MRTRVFLGAAIGLAFASVLVDFASIVLSVLADLVLVGGAMAVAGLAIQAKNETIRNLKAERDMLLLRQSTR